MFLRYERDRQIDRLVYTDESDVVKLTKARTTVQNMDMFLDIPGWLETLKLEQLESKDKPVVQSYSDI